MEWQVIVALVVIIPVILFPAAFVWYLNIGGIYEAVKEARKRRVTEEKKARELEGLTTEGLPITPLNKGTSEELTLTL
ncbi:MAG: hypothetical protein JSV77_03155 [Dehalococcoidales bacterium]|nr:MAG: hypothetical protein JSV77_03155 [Dehalococcoidales bacterium]